MTGDVVPLAHADDPSRHGAKAVGLGAAIRAGVDVPPGVALSGDAVDRVAAGDEATIETVMRLVSDLPTPLAVRSSAVDEDGADASFAGQHLTLLNVPSADDVPSALGEIWWSANSDSAITYRQRVGLFTRPSIGVVVQSLVDPRTAGVLFTQNPITGTSERLIEASWGLGEVVVAGRVIPDHFRLDTAGAVVEQRAGVKSVAVRTLADGGTEEVVVPPGDVESLCLDASQLAQLDELATTCEELFGPGRDIEWAFADDRLFLLQCRAITRAGSTGAAKAPVEPPDVLSAIPFFDGVDPTEADRIWKLFKQRRFAAGETIAKEGAGGAAFFVIDSGEAVVTADGRELDRLGRGDYFGEVSLIDDGARSATVTARTDVVCFGLTYWEFRPLVQRNATIAWNLLRTLAQRLRAAQR